MNPVMYIFLNKGLDMSVGKAAAQASHAAVESYRISGDQIIEAWQVGRHYPKVVLQADDSLALLTIEYYLATRGYPCELIIDEGRTEVAPFTPTALGVAIVDKDDPEVAAVFSSFKLYKKPEAKIGTITGSSWYGVYFAAIGIILVILAIVGGKL